jgi:hypothetical protein
LWFFWLGKCFSIEDIIGMSVVFMILNFKKRFEKLIKNGNVLLNKGSKSMFVKLSM